MLQIWLLANQNDVEPYYAQKRYRIAEEPDRLHLAASPDGREGSLPMKSDAQLYVARLNPKAAIEYAFASEGFCWLQVAPGA